MAACGEISCTIDYENSDDWTFLALAFCALASCNLLFRSFGSFLSYEMACNANSLLLLKNVSRKLMWLHINWLL